MYIYLLRRPAQVSLHALLAKSLNKKHLIKLLIFKLLGFPSIEDTLHFPISFSQEIMRMDIFPQHLRAEFTAKQNTPISTPP